MQPALAQTLPHKLCIAATATLKVPTHAFHCSPYQLLCHLCYSQPHVKASPTPLALSLK